MSNREEFEKRVNKSLQELRINMNQLEAKVSYLQDGVKTLNTSFTEFYEDLTDYMAFTAEQHADHEKRISNIESQLNS